MGVRDAADVTDQFGKPVSDFGGIEGRPVVARIAVAVEIPRRRIHEGGPSCPFSRTAAEPATLSDRLCSQNSGVVCER